MILLYTLYFTIYEGGSKSPGNHLFSLHTVVVQPSVQHCPCYGTWKTKAYTWCRHYHLCINAPMWKEKRWLPGFFDPPSYNSKIAFDECDITSIRSSFLAFISIDLIHLRIISLRTDKLYFSLGLRVNGSTLTYGQQTGMIPYSFSDSLWRSLM